MTQFSLSQLTQISITLYVAIACNSDRLIILIRMLSVIGIGTQLKRTNRDAFHGAKNTIALMAACETSGLRNATDRG